MVRLPLTSDPSRTFTILVGETRYRVTTRFNERSQVWACDITDADTNGLLVSNMPLVLGADILAAFAPRLGAMFVIDTTAEVGYGTDAGPEDLGSRIQVVWLEPGEVP